MPLTETQMQETLRRFRTTPEAFSDEQRSTLAAIQGRLRGADAVGKAQTVKTQAAKAKEAAVKAERQARDELDQTLAELETREGGLAADDGVGKAEINLERAKAAARYRPAAAALERATLEDDEAMRSYQDAVEQEQQLG